MPINIPDGLPAKTILQQERIFALEEEVASHQNVRPLRLVILNLMPTKIETETQILRLISKSPLQVSCDFMRVSSHESKNTSADHLVKFYDTFDAFATQNYDGLIVTGAPVELMAFEEVDYYEELTRVFDWADARVTSTLFLCWASQAALYHYYGLPKRLLKQKMFGVFDHKVFNRKTPLLRGFDDSFKMPHSRYTEVATRDIVRCPDLTILAQSEKAGVAICMAQNGRKVFVTGHPEYGRMQLRREYERDRKKGLDTALPENYFPDDDPARRPLLTWRAAANNLYTNWLNYYVYQSTPFALSGTPWGEEIPDNYEDKTR